MKLLLVEDEKRMGEALVRLLQLENYVVDLYTDGITGAEAVEDNSYDLIILDVMLPGKSGLEIAKQARQRAIETPILMLTAKAEPDDIVTGLDSGADDYLTKPFMSEELLARLRALKRRITNSTDETIAFGDITLDTSTSTLYCNTNGQSVRLSEKEFRIMEYFMINQRQIIKKEQLMVKVWGYDDEAEYNKVEVYLSFTRKKLTFLNSSVEIKALRGQGYELRVRNV